MKIANRLMIIGAIMVIFGPGIEVCDLQNENSNVIKENDRLSKENYKLYQKAIMCCDSAGDYNENK